MKELRFDGRTAVVTGAGGNPSLGRAHAMLLAARGANVVVNDIGLVDPSLGYEDAASAEAVAEEIRAAGGNAVADTNSVATEEGGAAIIQTALDAFGSIDILVNNAGICRVVSFEEQTLQDFRQIHEVNLMGTVHTCRAAWPHMKRQGYGRIVNVTSGSMTGCAWQSAYASAKAAVFSLSRSLAAEGIEHGIKVNSMIPTALTRMIYAAQHDDSPLIAEAKEHLPPEIVSPAVAFLAHEDVPFVGECIESIGGALKSFYVARTPGFAVAELTPEVLAERWQEILAGAAEGLAPHDEFDPRAWNPKPYIPSA